MNKFNLLKYLSKWKYLIFAVCVLGALIVYKYAMYNQEYTASTVISYTGQNAANGKTPSGAVAAFAVQISPSWTDHAN